MQFLHWVQNKSEYFSRLVQFDSESFKYLPHTKTKEEFLNKSLLTFISNLSIDKNEIDSFKNLLTQFPIFMNGSGNPDFKRFVNGRRI